MSGHQGDPRRIVVTRALMAVIDAHPSKDPTFGQMSDAVLDALDEAARADTWRDQMNHYLDGLGPLTEGI